MKENDGASSSRGWSRNPIITSAREKITADLCDAINNITEATR